jgi:hypothetical protein
MVDDNYEFGSSQGLPVGHDNREDYRLTARARAWLGIKSPEPGLEVPDTALLECQVRDISARGLSLVSSEPLALHSLLMAEISLGHQPKRFRLMVEVMWCREAGPDYIVGVHVLDSDETDYLDWMEAVASALSDS